MWDPPFVGCFRPSPFQAAEADLWRQAEDLPMLSVADAATHVLWWAIGQSPVEATDDDPIPAAYVRAHALLYIGVSTVRTTRAVMATIRSGYEPEALPMMRKLAELRGRAQRVRGDHSGQYAREWLDGRGPKPQRALVDPPEGMWEALSHMSHADARGVETFLVNPALTDEEQVSFLVLPQRDPETANGTLAMAACGSRDVAEALSLEHELTLPGLAALDADITAAFGKYLEPRAA